MCTRNTVPAAHRLNVALARLELLAEPATQSLLQTLEREGHGHLPELSRIHQTSPYRLRQRLRLLQDMELVYAPKRYPSAFAVNQYRLLGIRLRAKQLVEDLQFDPW